MNPWWKRPSPEERAPAARGRQTASREAAPSSHDGEDAPEVEAELSADANGEASRRPRRRRRGGGRGSRRGNDAKTQGSSAAFCDRASFMHALERADLEEGEVSDLFERLFSGGSGGQRFSYAADAERTALDDLLESNGFERLVVPSGDGRLAVQLALDAVGLAERHGTSRFLLMADNDALLPLAEALRKRQCEVVCLGAEGALAEGCDRSLEWGLSEASESPESSTAATAGSNGYESDSGRDSNPEDSSRDVDPFELLIEAISTVRQGLPGLMWGSVVLQTIQEQYPWFSQHNGGYESFEQLLESAQERGLITLERDSQADSYLITGFVEPAS